MYSDLINRGRELDAIATQGPWETGQYQSVSATYNKICNANTDGNAIFIAASRALVPQLCDELEAAQKEIERLSSLVDEACKVQEIRERKLTTRAEKAEAELKSVHEALDCADKGRKKCTNYTELAVSNGLALGKIAVAIHHNYDTESPESSADGN